MKEPSDLRWRKSYPETPRELGIHHPEGKQTCLWKEFPRQAGVFPSKINFRSCQIHIGYYNAGHQEEAAAVCVSSGLLLPPAWPLSPVSSSLTQFGRGRSTGRASNSPARGKGSWFHGSSDCFSQRGTTQLVSAGGKSCRDFISPCSRAVLQAQVLGARQKSG